MTKYRDATVGERMMYGGLTVTSFNLKVARLDKMYIQAIVALVYADNAVYIELDEQVLDLAYSTYSTYLSRYSKALNYAVCREWSLNYLIKQLHMACLAETIGT